MTSVRFDARSFRGASNLKTQERYPKDDAPAAYKDFDAVLDSVKTAGLASEVARLKARFMIKDADSSVKMSSVIRRIRRPRP